MRHIKKSNSERLSNKLNNINKSDSNGTEKVFKAFSEYYGEEARDSSIKARNWLYIAAVLIICLFISMI